MPVAVPTGDYEAVVSLDLSPVFSVVTRRERVRIDQPGPNALTRRLEELESEDPAVRQNAARQLMFFPENPAEAVPALLRHVTDPDGLVRILSITSLSRFPAAGEHAARLFAMLEDEDVTLAEKTALLFLLPQIAPADEKTLKAFEAAAASKDEEVRRAARIAIQTYRQRLRSKGPGERGK